MNSKDYYRIKTSFANYKVMVEHQYENMDRVHIGNKKKCIVMSVYFDDNEPNIDAIGYDENCNETGDLVQNTGTIHMIRSAMAFVVNHYKQFKFKKFQLKDKSTIRCSKGYWMPLNIYYLVKHGKTWYEKKLGAVPANPSKYKNDKAMLKKKYECHHIGSITVL